MINKYKIFLLALFPLLFSGFSGCDAFSYYNTSNITFMNKASQNLYIKFECIDNNSYYKESVDRFWYSESYGLESLISDGCYFILLYQKRDGSYCLVRKDKLGDLINMRAEKGFEDAIFTITPKGYDVFWEDIDDEEEQMEI